MTAAALVLAAMAASMHILIFVLESVLWVRPTIWERFGVVSQEQAEMTRSLAFNQGFYNLFLAIGTGVGIICKLAGQTTVGWTLIVFCCASMVTAAAVLLSTGLSYLRAAATQATLPLLALIFAALSRL